MTWGYSAVTGNVFVNLIELFPKAKIKRLCKPMQVMLNTVNHYHSAFLDRIYLAWPTMDFSFGLLCNKVQLRYQCASQNT